MGNTSKCKYLRKTVIGSLRARCDPAGDGGGLGSAELRLGRHGHRTEHAHTTFADLHREIRLQALLALVLLGNFGEARAHDLLRHAVAGGAAVGREQRLHIAARRRGRSHHHRCRLRSAAHWRRGRRLGGVGAAHRPDHAVLLLDVAVRVARKVGQERADGGLHRAVLHAGHVGHIALAIGFPQRLVEHHAVAVGHALLHIGNVLVAQGEIGRHHLGQAQDVGQHAIHLVGLERLGRVPGHGAVDVVPQGRDGGDLHHRGLLREGAARLQVLHPAALDVGLGGAAHDGGEHLVAFAKAAVAGGALSLPHTFTQGHAARAFGQALEVGAHVDVPGLHLGFGGVAAEVVPRRCLGQCGGADERCGEKSQGSHGGPHQ